MIKKTKEMKFLLNKELTTLKYLIEQMKRQHEKANKKVSPEELPEATRQFYIQMLANNEHIKLDTTSHY